MKGQPKDFDLLLQRKNDLNESAVIVEYFSNKEIDVISQTQFKESLVLFNDPNYEVITSDRLKLKIFIEEQCELWNMSESNKEVNIVYPKSIIITTRFNMDVNDCHFF